MASWCPVVDETASVAVSLGETSALPERLVEVGVEDLEKVAVDPGEDIFLGPFETECVFLSSVSGVKSGSLHVRAPPCIVCRVRTPVESRRDYIVSTLLVGVVVPAGLANIDLTRLRPWSIGVVHWQHPNCGPQPVTRRKLGGDLDTAVLDGSSFQGIDSS